MMPILDVIFMSSSSFKISEIIQIIQIVEIEKNENLRKKKISISGYAIIILC